MAFELRAYDARGAFTRQTWTVAVDGVNRPPELLPIANPTLNEGTLLELAVGGLDPDGDDLILWADRLPPGAVFDSTANVIRWRTGPADAGRYSDVRVYASDGTNVVFSSFEILVLNRRSSSRL